MKNDQVGSEQSVSERGFEPSALLVTVTKRFTIDAAHYLPDHDGKCRALHGHTYVIEVEIGGRVHEAMGAPDGGMVIDFARVKETAGEAIERYDHQLLNDHFVISEPPTAENIALRLFGEIQGRMDEAGIWDAKLVSVRVWETPDSRAEVARVALPGVLIEGLVTLFDRPLP